MISTKRLFLALCLIMVSIYTQAQLSVILSQKIIFQKELVTIEDALKTIIHGKKVNLSYSPDILNLKCFIHLPAKEISVKDLLFLIGNKTGNKVVVIGNQVIIKRDKTKVTELPSSKTKVLNAEIRDTFISRAPLEVPLIPKNIVFLEYKDSLKSGINLKMKSHSVTSKTDSLPTETTNEPEKSNKQIYTAFLTIKDFALGIGGGFDLAYLSNLSDSMFTYKAKSITGWHLQTNVKLGWNKKYWVETGVGINLARYSLKSLSRDTVNYQDIQLKVTNLELPLSMVYGLNIHQSYLTFGLGGYFQFALNGNKLYTNNMISGNQEILWNTTNSTSSSATKTLLYLHRINYGILGQIGYQRKKWKLLAFGRMGISPFSKYESVRVKQISLTFIYQIFQTK